MSVIRNYYLYIFYWASKNSPKSNGDPDPFYGFIGLGLLVIPFHIFIILKLLIAFDVEIVRENYYLLMNIELFEHHRGSVVNMLAVFVFSLGCFLTYFICCFKIKIGDISDRLSKSKFFATYSVYKLLSMILVIIPLLSWADGLSR